MAGLYPKVWAASWSVRSSTVGLVRPTGQLVVQDLLASGPAGQIEGDGAVEAPGPQQGGVEVGGPVGGPDDQHVGRRHVRLAQRADRPGGAG